MLQFMGYVLMAIVGLWLVRRSLRRKPRPAEKQVVPQLVPDPRVPVLERALKTMQYSNELDKRVAEDAMAREARATSALVAVMRNDGCTDEQIESVLREVENRKDGDLKS